MTDYTKLVEALRYCEFGWSARTCDNCEYSKTDCQLLLEDAAAAIDELKAIAHSHCVAASSYWEELEELKAQLPKRGEWIDESFGYNWYGKCSVCGEAYNIDSWYGSFHYCPNCGAKMGGME